MKCKPESPAPETFWDTKNQELSLMRLPWPKDWVVDFPSVRIWVEDSAHADLFTPGSHGTTYGGSPLACSAADAVLEIIEKRRSHRTG